MNSQQQTRAQSKRQSAVTNKSFSKYLAPASISQDSKQSVDSSKSSSALKQRSHSLGPSKVKDESKEVVDLNSAKRSIYTLRKNRVSWGTQKVLEYYGNDHSNSEEMEESKSDIASEQQRKSIINTQDQNLTSSNQKSQTKTRKYSNIKVAKEYELPISFKGKGEESASQSPLRTVPVTNVQDIGEDINDEVKSPTTGKKHDSDIEMKEEQSSASKMNDHPTPRKSDIQQQQQLQSYETCNRKKSLDQDLTYNVGRTFDLRKSLDQDQTNPPQQQLLQQQQQLPVQQQQPLQQQQQLQDQQEPQLQQQQQQQQEQQPKRQSLATLLLKELSNNTSTLATNSIPMNIKAEEESQRQKSVSQSIADKSALNITKETDATMAQNMLEKSEKHIDQSQSELYIPSILGASQNLMSRSQEDSQLQQIVTQQQVHEQIKQDSQQPSSRLSFFDKLNIQPSSSQQQVAPKSFQALLPSTLRQQENQKQQQQSRLSQIAQLSKQRQSVAEAYRFQHSSDPYQRFKPPTKFELLPKLLNIPLSVIQTVYEDPKSSRAILFDQIYQLAILKVQLVIPTSKVIIQNYTERLECQRKMEELKKIHQQIAQERSKIQEMNKMIQQKVRQVIQMKENLEVTNHAHIEHISPDQKCFELSMHNVLLISVKNLHQPMKLLKLTLQPHYLSLLHNDKSKQLIDHILRQVMINLKLKSGMLLDLNTNFSSDGYIQVKGSCSQMVKHLQYVTYGFEEVMEFIGQVNVTEYMQISDDKDKKSTYHQNYFHCRCIKALDKSDVSILFEILITTIADVRIQILEDTIKPFNILDMRSITSRDREQIKEQQRKFMSRNPAGVNILSQLNNIIEIVKQGQR